MAKVVPASEVGLGAIGRVRVSTSRARRGKILAVEHPVFGWIPYRQWALIKLIPEDRIVPAIIGGISAYWVLKISMDALGKFTALAASPEPTFLDLVLPGGALRVGFKLLLSPFFPEVPDLGDPKFSDLWTKNPIPFYGALLVSAMILAGVDPGDVLIAITNLIPNL